MSAAIEQVFQGLAWLHAHLGGTAPLELDHVAEQLTLGSVTA